jgi:hypothetical protein
MNAKVEKVVSVNENKGGNRRWYLISLCRL